MKCQYCDTELTGNWTGLQCSNLNCIANGPTSTTATDLPIVLKNDVIAPFIAIARGIPDNWPGECILRFDQRPDGSIYLGYHGINDAKDGITINQWRALVSLKKGIV